MEDTLRGVRMVNYPPLDGVLILVLMEDTLRDLDAHFLLQVHDES